MQEQPPYPILLFDRKTRRESENERRQRSVRKYLAHLQTYDAAQTRGAAARFPPLVTLDARRQDHKHPGAEARCPDEPWLNAPHCLRNAAFRARDETLPTRPANKFVRAIRTAAVAFGGTGGTKRALVGTYEGRAVRLESCPTAPTTSFHLKLHAGLAGDNRPRKVECRKCCSQHYHN
jgi:hypothetical protein